MNSTSPFPAVTVAMSMHNASRFLRECVDSVLAQSFTDFEFLIVDDGSTDDSVRIVRSYSDPRIRLICRPHDFIASLNTLLDQARGRYIARMDADDIMLPHRLQEQVAYLDRHPDVAAVASNAITIDENSLVSGRIGLPNDEIVTVTPRMMCEDNAVCNPSTMMRSEAVNKAPLRYEPSFVYAEDYRFWCRFLLDCGRIDILPQPLVRYRRSPGQVTSARYDEMMAASERIRSDLVSHLVTEANPGYADPVIEKTDRGHELTLIIPFLNEGSEVEATVRSFREFGGDRMDVIVINDCSYDSYPYMERLRSIPGVTYILNRQRLGVAASRDNGVALCRTPYFLLLDAHMRAYDDSWLTEIPRLLRENDRRILCCQTKPLDRDLSGKVTEDSDTARHFGARLTISHRPPVPGIDWIDEEQAPSSATETIPAVLGAGYGVSRRYWNKLGGLKGLREYGCDEQLISLKAWLDGGCCLLLKNVVLGHIYRKQMPYMVNRYVPIFNNLLVTETLFPLRERIMARASAYATDRESFLTAFDQIRTYLTANPDMRMNGPEHRRQFARFIDINSRPSNIELALTADIASRIDDIKDTVISDLPECFGLYNGLMGRALWLMLYARAKNDDHARHTACDLIRQVSENLPLTDKGFASGLSGIGWSLIYLDNEGFQPVSPDVLEVVDRAILSTDISPTDKSFDTGTAGIMAYLCARTASVKFRNKINSRLTDIDRMADGIISSPCEPIAAYHALLWLQLRRNNFTESATLCLTDWMKPSMFVARDRRFWSLSICDGVPASSITAIINTRKYQ